MTNDLRNEIAEVIMQHDVQLLHDFDIDSGVYKMDPECTDAAYAEADAILAKLDPDALIVAALEAAKLVAAEWEETWEKRGDEQASVGAGFVFRDIRTLAADPEARAAIKAKAGCLFSG